MSRKKIGTDDGAVSPVIGVILMIAITVLLAAVTASFAFGLGEEKHQTTPTASFSFDYSADSGSNPGKIEIAYDGGDSISPERLSVVGNKPIEASRGNTQGDDTLTFDESDPDGFGLSDDLSAGTTVTVYESDGGTHGTAQFDEIKLEIIFTDDSGDTSSTLATWDGPDA